MAGFRPLIRGFFFYTQKKHCFPHFTTGGFRPLIRGFFFYGKPGQYVITVAGRKVSVPSFGDSFFMWTICGEIATDKEDLFPSPYSGILFL